MSMAAVLRFLGLRQAGGSHTYLSRRIRALSIDTTHFTGSRTIEAGVPYRCACGVEGTWQGRELKLQVDHLNRDWLDDRIENLRFICPNCHSQTDGWCGSKGGTSITDDYAQSRNRRKIRRVAMNATVGELVYPGDLESPDESHAGSNPVGGTQKTKISWPSVVELRRMLDETSYVAVSRLLGVSDNAIRKHLKVHDH
jgi:hypothetical protein